MEWEETSFPLEGYENDVRTVTVSAALKRLISHDDLWIAHGDRRTPVYRWATTGGDNDNVKQIVFQDAYGQEIERSPRNLKITVLWGIR